MFEKCKVKGKYCEGIWCVPDGTCDCMVDYPDDKCNLAIDDNKPTQEVDV